MLTQVTYGLPHLTGCFPRISITCCTTIYFLFFEFVVYVIMYKAQERCTSYVTYVYYIARAYTESIYHTTRKM